MRDEVAAMRQALVSGLEDMPTADDFQPLADHLYEFAQATPRLAGQIAYYTGQQLDAFAARRRKHPAPQTATLTPPEREQVAAYFASLGR